jgi:uncharacterized protein
VSRQDLEIVQRWYDAFNRGDMETWLDLLDPEVTWQAAREDPDSALHRGRDGSRRYVGQWMESYDSLRVEPLELLDCGEQVVVWARVTGAGRSSGIALDMEQAHVMTVREGLIVRLHEYFDRAEALEAARSGP